MKICFSGSRVVYADGRTDGRTLVEPKTRVFLELRDDINRVVSRTVLLLQRAV
jgi:hypothetical protein